MQVVFLNTFEKPSEDGRIMSAQLSIGEVQGLWSVHWLEDGDARNTDLWFEGTSWREMMMAFRYGVAKMMGEGYTPIINGMLEEERTSGSYLMMLQCYGELHANEELFQALRDWRRKTSAAEKKSAYLVATNRILWMISAFIPYSEEELNQIPGWGKAKHAAYGAAVLAITKQVSRLTSFPLDWVTSQLDPEVYTGWLFKQKENKYKALIDREQEKKRMLTIVQQGGRLSQLEEELSLSRRDLLLRMEGLEQEGYNMESLIESELREVPNSEQQLIWDGLKTMGDRYLKPVLAHVYGNDAESSVGLKADVLYERLRLMRMRYRRNKENRAI